MNLQFGSRGQLEFENESEYFKQLGILANGFKNGNSIVIEQNEEQGAWGKEGRVQCKADSFSHTKALETIVSKGNASIAKRYNCNDYVKNLVDSHEFTKISVPGKTTIRIEPKNIETIKATVPTSYLSDFEEGFNQR